MLLDENGGQFERSPGQQIERDDKLIVVSVTVEGSCDGWAAEVTDVLRGGYKTVSRGLVRS